MAQEEKVVDTVVDPEEMNAAEEEAKNDTSSAFVLKLHKPFTHEGKTYEELEFDYESLTGKDSLAVEQELESKGIMVLVPSFNSNYLVRIAARACTTRIGVDFIERLPIKEYNRIRSKTRNFLMASEQ